MCLQTQQHFRSRAMTHIVHGHVDSRLSLLLLISRWVLTLDVRPDFGFILTRKCVFNRDSSALYPQRQVGASSTSSVIRLSIKQVALFFSTSRPGTFAI